MNNELPIFSNELNEYEYEIDILYGKSDLIENKKFRFFIFFNAITDDKYPYMRITDGNHLSYTKSCRISLIEPKYLDASDDPLDTWRFNNTEKNDFINMLKLPVQEVLKNLHSFKGKSFWEYLLESYDFQVDNQGDKCLAGRTMPDYNLL